MKKIFLLGILLVACAGTPQATQVPPATIAPTLPPAATQPSGGPVIVTAAGDLKQKVDEYKSLFGGADNGGTPGSQPAGFRTITWDTVPD